MRTGHPLSITKTKGEWDLIDEIISIHTKHGLTSYLRQEINKLKAAFDKCPDCVVSIKGKKKRRRPSIPRNQYADLVLISKRMGIPPSEVIIRLIIDPILVPEY